MKTKIYLLSAVLLIAYASGAAFADGNLFPCRLASCTTYFHPGVEREKNVRLAVERLDGFILHPGSEFSFNETVTWQIPREELGYAPAILDGVLMPAPGGGLCQVSSTLYAAALSAGLTITERKNHSSPVGYISAGLDATVSSTEGIDLKFRNDEREPFLIRAESKPGILKISVFSTRPAGSEITVSVTQPETDGSFLNVTTTRTTVKNGHSSSEIISRDRYMRIPPSDAHSIIDTQ